VSPFKGASSTSRGAVAASDREKRFQEFPEAQGRVCVVLPSRAEAHNIS